MVFFLYFQQLNVIDCALEQKIVHTNLALIDLFVLIRLLRQISAKTEMNCLSDAF